MTSWLLQEALAKEFFGRRGDAEAENCSRLGRAS
jgi:hypothetical protein